VISFTPLQKTGDPLDAAETIAREKRACTRARSSTTREARNELLLQRSGCDAR
jgi:hypothetical protein